MNEARGDSPGARAVARWIIFPVIVAAMLLMFTAGSLAECILLAILVTGLQALLSRFLRVDRSTGE